MHGVGDGLSGEPRVELPQHEVGDEGRRRQAQDAHEQVRLAEQDQVADGPHGAEPASLGKKPDGQPDAEGHEERGVHGARPFQAVEQDVVFRFSGKGRKDEGQGEKSCHDRRQYQPCRTVGLFGAAQVIARFEEKCADPDPEGETEDPQDCIQVAAGEPEQCPPGTAQEYQGTDHGEHPEHEPHDGCGAGPGTELLKQQCGHQGAQDEPDDLGTHVLHHLGPVEPQGAGDVTFEACHADAHVAWVAQLLQQWREDADKGAYGHDAPQCCEYVLHLHAPTSSPG
ncbi:MAG: hypothetical protein BWX71_01193 [Deltaproteobacteria bacterium ADurb.Bin072]|nr:MAG: hypothetical protein BWX71_01193 [Deltaproteobacteria bacterium ADurb.Bin072]